MEHKVFTFEIFGKTELLIGCNVSKKRAIVVEECHGLHEIEDEDIKVELTSVELVVAGKGINILGFLTSKQQQEIIDNLPL